jgi:hypothetical protein
LYIGRHYLTDSPDRTSFSTGKALGALLLIYYRFVIIEPDSLLRAGVNAITTTITPGDIYSNHNKPRSLQVIILAFSQ